MRNTFLIFAACFSFARLTAQSIYELSEVMEVRIYFDRPDWDTYLDSLKQLGSDDRLEGQVVVNGIKYEKAGVRYKGNSSYFNVRNSGAAKLPFNIKVNYKDKRQSLPGGYATLKLSNVFRDPSFLREVLSYEIAGKYMPAPKANFAKVFVNDKFLGLYNNTESVDEKFLRKYFADNSGSLLKCDPNWHAKKIPDCPEGDKASLMYLGEDSTCYMGLYELKTKTGWNDLIYLTKVLNKQSESLEQVMDVDQFLWMLAFNNVLVNLDSYTGRLCHNYYIYRDTLGFYHPIVWDMNLSLGGFRYTGLGSPLSNEKMQRLSPFVHYKQKNPKRPLITNLLGNSLYRKIYIAHIRTILQENFSNAAYLKRAEEIRAMIDPFVQEDQNKLYSYEAFQDNSISVMMNGMTVNQQKFDGEKGQLTQMGQKQELKGAELEDMKRQAVLFPELTYKEDGYSMELKGIEKIDGENAYRIVLSKGETKFTEYFSVKTSLKLRSINTQDSSAGRVTVTNDYSAYDEVDGIKFPHQLTTVGVMPIPIEMKISSIAINKGIDDSVFSIE